MNPSQIPLFVTAEGQPEAFDLDRTPHLFVAARPGLGGEDVLRTAANHVARHGGRADFGIGHPNPGTGLDPKVGLHTGRDQVANLIEAARQEVDARLWLLDQDQELDGLRLLVLEDVGWLWSRRDRAQALDDLLQVGFLGRAAGVHLVLSALPDSAVPVELLNCVSVLTLGPVGRHPRARLFGGEPVQPLRAGWGSGELLAGDQPPRPVTLAPRPGRATSAA
ncbi:hypothetical protein [Kitasatospora sp. MBT66]|uniref:hypothetical protein n=1 Tax=Kitasatospora sp. MBT66 TaxID=1444769 RepID=UPI0005B7FB5F|nr:hypothetical protein [Kitasatospora sp. MBT66]